ncbi:MAG: hypothetical protein FJ125_02045 [Deltaproteobacteria bacterium]|nr:hypothetical protein [Deltaproteobacteria bacterium]
MERTIHGYRFEEEKPVAVGVSSVTYRAVREGAADVQIPVSIKVIDLSGPLEETGQRPNVDLLDSPPLQHGNIVDVRDVIRMGPNRVGIVRELVDGPSASMLLERLGDQPLAPSAALYIARQCSSALAYAHGRNLVHGDFCHRHVLLSMDGQVKVSDFQLSGLLARAGRSETRLRAGKRFFVAPELLRRPSPHPAAPADVFALGVLLYRMICGLYPFADTDALLAGRMPSCSVGDEEWGPPTSKLLFECLSLDPELRPPASEVERRLRRILGPSWPGYGGAELAEFLATALQAPSPQPATAKPTRVHAGGAPRAAAARPAVICHAPLGAGNELPPGPLRPPPPGSSDDPPPTPLRPLPLEVRSGADPAPESTAIGRRPEPPMSGWPVAPPPPLQEEEEARTSNRGGKRSAAALQELSQRVGQLEALLGELLERQHHGDPLIGELLERLATLEQANTYLAHELTLARNRMDALIGGLAGIIQQDTQT